MNRISLYKKPYIINQIKSSFEDEPRHIRFDIENEEEEHFLIDIIASCKEIVFLIKDEEIVFSCIMIFSSENKDTIEYRHAIDLIPKEKDLDLLTNNTLFLISISIINEVPIIPDTNDLAESLALMYSKAIKFGFNYYENGNKRNATFETGLIKSLSPIRNFKFLNLARLWSPGEIAMLKYDIEIDFERFRKAESILSTLRFAIRRLNNLLKSEKRNENRVYKNI